MRLDGKTLNSTSTPYDFFELLCDDDFFQNIVEESNLFNTQHSTSGYPHAVKKNNQRRTSFKLLKPVTISEIKRAFGIILYMGICKLPNRRMYWGTSTAISMISSSLTRNRFEEIISILHFNDNSTMIPQAQDGSNKLHKIQPIIDHFRKVFTQTVVPETYQAIDEVMIPFKGHHGAKMYMPKKPVKWGYKLWCRAGISGYVYDFEVYGGNDAKGPPSDVNLLFKFGESENVVLRLTRILDMNRHKVFFNNLFTSPELMIQLKHQGIFAVGTLRADRSRGCPISTESAMRKKGRGTNEEFVEKDHDLVICAWYDNRRVLTISNFVGKEPVSQANRYDRKNNKQTNIGPP